MDYKINDKELKANIFISFVNKVWKGQYNIEKTEAALSKTINITAYDGDILVGCLRILTDGYFFGTITELLVLPEYQKQGIGTALIKEGHRIARELGYGFSVVLGSANYYPRVGYLPADTFGIYPPFDVPRENFMAYKFNENAPDVQGIIQYAEEFGIG